MEDNKDIWNPDFYQSTPLFSPIAPAAETLNSSHKTWPGLEDYNQLISNQLYNRNNKPIKFVKQSTQCNKFEDEYEPRIFCKGEVQTRLNNWHDYFQVLVWKTFPRTKSLLNQIHFDAATKRNKNKQSQRSPRENFVTLFDECGSIFISTEKSVIDMVKNFKWSTLFQENAIKFSNSVECLVFGHAMYEKALQPYIGMTTHCLFLIVDKSYFSLSTEDKTQFVDKTLETEILNIEDLNTKSLSPLPILGVPGWHPDQTDNFYNNQSYFRPGRRASK